MTSSADFSFDIRRQVGAVVVTPRGQLDLTAAARLGTVLGDLIEGQGNLNVVVDLRHVASVEPAGTGVFGAAAKVANHHGGKLTLSEASNELRHALATTGIAEAVAVTGGADDLHVHHLPVHHHEGGASASAARHAHHHVVEFYPSDELLGETVSQYLQPALRGDDAVIVVATEQHRHLFESALVGVGVDIEGARSAARYIDLDAEETLSLFMVDGAPDPALFEATTGGLIARAASGGRRVRVYGEMVAVLWAQGNVAAAIALEDLWNELARSHRFSLFCAYPLTAFDAEGVTGAFRTICEQHCTVIPAGR